jgi:UDP-3-O-[3-hydroxymyristoyl] N-acetylglucosamine deacetylase
MTLRPAPADHGIRFRRTDVTDRDPEVLGRWDFAVPSALCTRVRNADGVEVSTIEHVMAALAGCGIHNALVDLDGPEVPILDGSALPFVRGLLNAGRRRQSAPIRALRVLRPVEVSDGPALARLESADTLEIDFSIEFRDAAIGRQEKQLRMANGAFVHELCTSRTFCLRADVERMRAHGLALGGTLENAVVFDGGRVLSPGGLRQPDEPVRHKMLDALGDLALAGAPILGRYIGIRAGHALTARLLADLFASPGAVETVEIGAGEGGNLPGVGLGRRDIPALA